MLFPHHAGSNERVVWDRASAASFFTFRLLLVLLPLVLLLLLSGAVRFFVLVAADGSNFAVSRPRSNEDDDNRIDDRGRMIGCDMDGEVAVSTIMEGGRVEQ